MQQEDHPAHGVPRPTEDYQGYEIASRDVEGAGSTQRNSPQTLGVPSRRLVGPEQSGYGSDIPASFGGKRS